MKRSIQKESSEKISIPLQEEDESLYLYTSGTTGKPKAVVLTNDLISPASLKRYVLPC